MKTTDQKNTVSPESISKHAYHLWEQAGRPSGRDMDFWLIAEAQLKTPKAETQAAPKAAPPKAAPTAAPKAEPKAESAAGSFAGTQPRTTTLRVPKIDLAPESKARPSAAPTAPTPTPKPAKKEAAKSPALKKAAR